MIHTRVAFLHTQITTMRMADVIQPASFVTADRIHDEGVIPLPVSYRVSVPPGTRGIGGTRAHILGKFSPVRPDFAPCPVVLEELQHLARHLREGNPSGFEKDVAREPQWITRLDGVIRFPDGILRLVLIGMELFLPPRRHGRYCVESGADEPCPKPRQILAG